MGAVVGGLGAVVAAVRARGGSPVLAAAPARPHAHFAPPPRRPPPWGGGVPNFRPPATPRDTVAARGPVSPY